eukprot:TRINITY_DN4741_c1_g1_i17.p2 TRINITY_DN4741_c1_g1~~TRINITY_DN4741_c1_g1_i17.p2  ORF type:complete len:678 (+),score=176.75 TRINITY_DN4741_c1_g1_i17:3400-5433(+)
MPCRPSTVLVACLLALAASSTLARPASKVTVTSDDDRVHIESFRESGKVVHPRHGWYQVADPALRFSTPLDLVFALKRRNVDALYKKLHAVSDPDSPEYRHYLSARQVGEQFGASPAALRSVRQWLLASGVPSDAISVTTGKEFMRVRVSKAVAERLLHTEFHTFAHPTSTQRIVRALSKYTVPRAVAPYLDFVGGVHRFPNVARLESAQHAGVNHRVLPTALPSHRKTSGNASVPLLVSSAAGGPSVTLFFVPTCGSAYASGPGALCNGTVAAINIVQSDEVADTTVIFPVPVPSGQTTLPDTTQLTCHTCSGWPGYQGGATLGAACAKVGLPEQTVFCAATVNSVTPFRRYSYTVQQAFTTGSNSPASDNSGVKINHPWIDAKRLQQLYNVAPYFAPNLGFKPTTQAVAEFLNQFYAQSDLEAFFKAFSIPSTVQPTVFGPNNQSLPGLEATLDIQYILAMAPQSPTAFWSFAGAGQNPSNQEPFLEWMMYLSNQTDAPLVHSISYDDQENLLTPEYMMRGDTEFAAAGVRGISLLFCAGDDGVGGVALRDPKAACDRFSPAWPASSPSATAVGGTQLGTDYTQDPPIFNGQTRTNNFMVIVNDQQGEKVSSTTTGSMITTGGGFSDTFATPAWQSSQVQGYLKSSGVPPTKWFNTTGRGYPDISAMATNYLVSR